MNTITKVEPNSIAHELGIEPGDTLLDINAQEIKDIFDYRYLIKDEYLEITIQKPNGEEWLLEIEKDEDEDLGLEYQHPLMSCETSCKNKCIFCFIDQNPKGMREPIYFKDDDSRLSFLDGNFVSLTNISDEELERIIFYRLSPINISVHATDPDLRTYMLKNPRASKVLEQIKKITDAGLVANFQVVLCKGINDGPHLDRTIQDLGAFLPLGQHISIVPLGLTKHRQGLQHLQPWDKNGATQVIEQVSNWQAKFKQSHGTNFAFLADEFYILAEQPIPPHAEYEQYNQLENGVGMMRLFMQQVKEELSRLQKSDATENGVVSVLTGTIAHSYINQLCADITAKFGVTINVYPIQNSFYGGAVTVSGLLTGGDIIEQLQGKPLGNKLLVPKNLLKNNEEILLDDTTVQDIQQALGVNVVPCNVDGCEFVNKIIETNG